MKRFRWLGRAVGELRRRKVARVVALYLAACWVLLQVVNEVGPAVNAPPWLDTAVVILSLIGLPIAVATAWAFALTADNMVRDSPDPGSGLPVANKRSPHSIAVLPFANLSADADNEYFSDGMTEELIDRLTRISGLKVAARTSAFAFKGKNADVKDIARQLRVGHLLEGSVRKAGTRLRVTAQLIDADSGYHLWSESFERELEDVFRIQDEIGRAIVAALEIRLSQPAIDSTRRRTSSVESYDLYLRGRFLWNQRTDAALREAIDHFERALDVDPANARAYAGIADCYLVISSTTHGSLDPQTAIAKARAAAEQALTLDSDLADAHLALGTAFLHQYRWADSAAEYKRALELEPGHAGAYHRYGWWLALRGHFADALDQLDQAHRLDPLSLPIQVAIARVFEFMHRSDDSIAQARSIIQISPEYAPAHFALGLALIGRGRPLDAIEAFQRAYRISPNPGTQVTLGVAFAAAGQRTKAHEILNELLALSQDRYVSGAHLADLWVALGNYEQALTWYEKAYAEKSSALIYLKVEPTLDPMHDHPRFQQLLAQVGLADEIEGVTAG